jgi:XTP/dITP diphosphohydrolase
MVMKIACASNNLHKLDEISEALDYAMPGKIILLGLKELGIVDELPETSNTLEGNAIQKAEYIFHKYAINCLADDTGLEVFCLQNRPGVYSARYAGIGCSYEDNINKLLKEMEGMIDRRARFRTVISLILDGNNYLFEGSVEGFITNTKAGLNGFGYDPVFLPDGLKLTFAEMDLKTKNRISHRAKAVNKLVQFLLEMNSKGIFIED